MFLSVCEHPLRVKVGNKFKYVPCGKCNTCRNRSASQWIDRIKAEFSCHKYAVFVTLTYDEKNVPTLDLTKDASTGEYVLFNHRTDECFSLSDIKDFKPASRLYVARRKFIPYLRKKDLQDFLKRFRFFVDNLLLNTDEYKFRRIRYFAAGEYGPTTLRPHFHPIIFFDSETLSRRFGEVLNKAWRFGISDFKHCTDGTSEYVARYVNSISALPKVYHHRQIRPFSLASKCPALGSLAIPETVVSSVFHFGYKEMPYALSAGNVKNVPIPRFLETRLFPKVQGFSNLSHNSRVTLYSVYSLCPVEGFENFVSFVKELISKPYDTFLSDYIRVLYENDCRNHIYENDFCSLKSLYYTSSRVVHQCRIFHCSLDYYVYRIEEYYTSKNLNKLSKFYQSQNDYYAKYSSTLPLVFMYTDNIKDIIEFNFTFDFSKLSDSVVNCLRDFGFDLSSHFAFNRDFSKAKEFYDKDYFEMSVLNRSIVDKSKKTKKRKDYLQNCYNHNSFNFNILKNYE